MSLTPRNKFISIVVPVYNEEKNISYLVGAIEETMLEMQGYGYEVIFIDDGSTDGTLHLLQEAATRRAHLFYVRLSRNFGHQNALKAGIDLAKGACVISMDGDGQHPPSMIPQLVRKWEEGFDVVYTRRIATADSGRTKNVSSSRYYKILNRLSDVEIEEGTADFRLLDERVAAVIRRTQEYELFLRGMVRWVGFRQYAIDYSAPERYAGETKYTLAKMISLALRGITSFSTRPLYFATYLGLAFALGAVLYLPYILYSYFTGNVVSGWASLIATIVFFGGLQLLIMGIIGIYIGKTFMQVKNRPHYLIQETNLA
jgi:dolichol-phosphate mannosyltransferase